MKEFLAFLCDFAFLLLVISSLATAVILPTVLILLWITDSL